MEDIRNRHRIASRVAGAARTAGGALLDLLFPPLCVGCEDRLPAHVEMLPLCPTCRRVLPHAPPDALDARLAKLGPDASVFDARLALWTFDDGGVLQRLQHRLKYGDRPTLGLQLGRQLGAFWERTGYPVPDMIVPLPLARTRFLTRGYNQAERLADGIGLALGAPLANVLIRSRATRSQTSLSRELRRANVAGAFMVPPAGPPLDGRRVLLVDDVVTTGATVVAAAAPLLAAGATVDLAVLALTQE